MEEKQFYLKPQVYIEPLVHNWYAWPYMLPPVTCAMLFSDRILKMMKSFVASYKLHIAASKNKELTGGSFVNCSESQLGDMKVLIDKIQQDFPEYKEIRQAIKSLHSILHEQTGLSLEALYQDVPDVLKGFIELHYNENHNASFRMIEGLLYRSSLYQKKIQSLGLGVLEGSQERPFVLSTPRLPSDNFIELSVSFEDSIVDELAQAREKSISRERIEQIFSSDKTRGDFDFWLLFTHEAPDSVRKVGERLQVDFLGHAGVSVRRNNTCVLIDPVIPVVSEEHRGDVLSFADLPEKIDYVCVTHTHMDHTCIETLLQLRHKTDHILVPKNNSGSICDPSIKLMLQNLGFRVSELEDMEDVFTPDLRITAIPFLGEHADLHIRSKSAWLIEAEGYRVLFAADSSNLEPQMYEHIRNVTGEIDVLFIGMECVGAPMSWLYGSFFSRPVSREINESRRFNGSDYKAARNIVDVLSPGEVYIYALGMEEWFKYFMGLEYDQNAKQIEQSDLLIDYCTNKGIKCQRMSGHVSLQYDVSIAD